MTDRFEDIVAGLDGALHRAAQKELDHAEFHRQITNADQHFHHSAKSCDGDLEEGAEYDPCKAWENSAGKYDALNDKHKFVGVSYHITGPVRRDEFGGYHYCLHCQNPLPASLDGYDNFYKVTNEDGTEEDL